MPTATFETVGVECQRNERVRWKYASGKVAPLSGKSITYSTEGALSQQKGGYRMQLFLTYSVGFC